MHSALQTFSNVGERWTEKKFCACLKFFLRSNVLLRSPTTVQRPNARPTTEKRPWTFSDVSQKSETLSVRWLKRHGVTAP